ncbi:MAG TPA: saccharopine dehydrogenase NADP-binding domain-containing protein, partial [Ktedonobacterales bacterium]
MHLIVLGGGGAMGRITVRTLAEDARVSRITVADVNLAAAEHSISWLEQGHDKAHAVACDVRDERATTEMLHGAAAILNATDYPYNLHVMRAALAARVSYADLGGLFHMTRRQYELDAAFKEAG